MSDDSRIYAALSYVCFVLSGMVVYMIREKDPYARFHAMQSMLFTVALFIFSFIIGAIQLSLVFVPFLRGILGLLLSLVGIFAVLVVVALWLVMMYKAYSGERYKLPFIGELASSMASK